MMENLQWLFDGIGTELFILGIGAITGGLAGYRVGLKKNAKQTQNAKSDSNQRQELIVDEKTAVDGKTNEHNNIRQKQTAGGNSEQVQIGRIRNGRE